MSIIIIEQTKRRKTMEYEILFTVRCYPTRTINKVAAIKSNATCYITELLKPDSESKPFSQQKDYKEVNNFDELKKAAEQNPDKDCLIKTASLHGRARFFIER